MAENPRDQHNDSPAPEELLARLCPSVLLQSPIATWIADKNGTSIFMNDAARKFFGLEPDESPGRYNIFEDEIVQATGLLPEVHRVFEQGGTTDSVVDYDASKLRHVKLRHPFHKVLRTFLFAIKDEAGKVQYVAVQHEDLTDRAQAERALAQEEERFRALSENATDLVVILSADGTVRYVSPSIVRLLGYAPGDVISRNVLEFIHPDDQDKARKALEIAVASETHTMVQVRVKTKDGAYRHMESIASGFIENPAIGGIVLNVRDITERVLAEEALRQSEAELRAVISAMSDVVIVLDSEGRYIRIAPTTPNNLLYKPAMELLGRTLHEVFPKWQADEFLGYIHQALTEHRTVSTEYELDIDGQHIWFYAAISPMTDNQALWVARDITSLKSTEAELRRIVDELSIIVAASPVAIICLDLDGKVISWNPSATKTFGWSADEVMNAPIPIMPADERRTYEEIITRLMRDEPVRGIEFSALRKDGSRICVNASMAPMHDANGRIIGFMGLIEDVTESAQALRELKESEAKFRTLAENAHAAIGVVQGTKFIYVNPYLAQVSGYTYEELLDMDISQVLAPEYREMVVERAKRRQMGLPEPSHYEFKLLTKSGEERWLDFSPALITYKGRPAIVGVAYDITNRKQAEEALEEAEAKYRSLVEQSLVGVYMIQDGKFVYVNPQEAHILGYDVDELIGMPVLDTVVPECRELVEENLRKRLTGGMQSAHYSFRALRKDGRVIDVEVLGTRTTYHGQPAVIGTAIDITERKKAEDALRRSEENFRALFDSMPAAVFSYDQNAVILQVNPAFQRVFGFSAEQAVGRSMFETIARPQDRELTFEVTEQVFSGKRVENIEWQDVRADGTPIYVISSTTPVYSPSGEIIYGLSMGIDITERREAAERASELEEHKREFYRCTILAATEGKLEVTERQDILEIAGPPIAEWEILSAEDLSRIRQDAGQIARADGMDDDRACDFVLAVGEATTNAYKHAGGGTASLHRVDDDLMFVVSDHGRGMEALALPELAFTRGYTTAESLGMGYKAILSVADKVYLATGPSGTTVAIEMSLRPVEKPIPILSLPDTW